MTELELALMACRHCGKHRTTEAPRRRRMHYEALGLELTDERLQLCKDVWQVVKLTRKEEDIATGLVIRGWREAFLNTVAIELPIR